MVDAGSHARYLDNKGNDGEINSSAYNIAAGKDPFMRHEELCKEVVFGRCFER